MPATTQRIRAELDQLPAGQPVGYTDFVHEPAEFGAVALWRALGVVFGRLAPYPTVLAVCNWGCPLTRRR